jgi:hypothetical protein
MANLSPPFLLHPKDALAAPADTLIPDWGTA